MEAFVEIVPIVVCEAEVSEMAAEELSSLYSTVGIKRVKLHNSF